MSIRDVGHRLYTGEVSYDFVGRKRTWYTLSAIILLVSVAALLLRGLNFGIEFRGGAEFRLPGATCSVQEARESVLPFTTAEPIVQQLGNGEIRVQTEVLELGADGPSRTRSPPPAGSPPSSSTATSSAPPGEGR